MPNCRLLLLFGLAVVLPVHAAKNYHLWYDENGQAVYSQFAPDDGRPSETVKGPPPPAEPPEVARQRLQEQKQKSADYFEDKELAREKTAAASTQAEQLRKRCEAARQNLEVLEGPPNRLYQGSDGSIQRLPEEEREKQRAEMRKIIAEDCR